MDNRRDELERDGTDFIDDVLHLFGFDLSSDEWMARLHEALTDQEDASPEPQELEGPGTHVGPYVLLDRLGMGGMGTVWRARRTDGRPDRVVALKLIRSGLHSRSAIRRFRLEEQVLARLEHANIARLYDGGTSGNGRPYLVMEHVQGLPITEYARRNQLSVEEKLSLFQKVCDAVQYAHGSLILHRDIKPGNILVTDDGTPKLLDFGIAKLLEGSEEETANLTVTDVRVLTPQYASPEQIRGQPLSVATDMYSLGVVLYELLIGVVPHKTQSGVRHELERAILEEEILRPSAAVQRLEALTPAKRRTLSRRVQGDIDAICLKALQKSVSDRYRSVLELGEDIGRHLDGRPLLAKPPGMFTRAHRAIRRRRGAIAATLAGVVLGLAAAATYVAQAFLVPGWQEERIRQARLAIIGHRTNTVIYNLLFFNYDGWSGVNLEPGFDESWAAPALDRYRTAIKLGDVGDQVAAEYAMLELAKTVRNSPEDIDAILGELREETPLTRWYLEYILEHRERPEIADEDFAEASDFDLRCLGLVSFFLLDQFTAIDSWVHLPLSEPDPVVEAILGYVHLALDESELAYARLLGAYRRYPESGTLAVYLADAAARVGDLALADYLLAVEPGMVDGDPHLARKRVQALVNLKKGDEQSAFALLCIDQIARYNAVAAVQFAHYLEETRGPRAAVRALAGRVVPGRIEQATFEYYAILMEAWWARLSEGERQEIYAADWGAFPIQPASLQDYLRRYAIAIQGIEKAGRKSHPMYSRGGWANLHHDVARLEHETASAELLSLASRLPNAPKVLVNRLPDQCDQALRSPNFTDEYPFPE